MIKVVIYTVCFLAVAGLSMFSANGLFQWGWKVGFGESEQAWAKAGTEAAADKLHAVRTLRDSLAAQAMDFAVAVEELEVKNIEDKENAEHAKDLLIDAIMSGSVRLYLPTKEGSHRGVNCGGSPSPSGVTVSASSPDGETSSELHPAATAFLFRLTGEADELADTRNELIDFTNLLLEQCNATRPN